jgi:hypothetical protein
MQYISVKKIGKVDSPKHPESDFRESKKEHVGLFTGNPEIGELFLAQGLNWKDEGIKTSPVTKITDDNTFETLNSVYHWEFIEK